MIGSRQVLDLSHDVVVVIPGIMGSALADEGRVQRWGLTDPRWYARALAHRNGLAPLRLSEEERADPATVRLRPTGLLRTPAFLPGLGGVEPYTRLVDRLRRVVVHPDLVLEFAYDWRLPVLHNARLLADAARRHLQAWRDSDGHQKARREQPDEREARLVLVAHSMGGLLARALTLVAGDLVDDIRDLITLGTPLRGSPLAAVLLATGRGTPIWFRSDPLRKLAATLPGVHDLLPSYRCVDEGTDVRLLTASDVAHLGGDARMAEDAARLHAMLDAHLAPELDYTAYGGFDQVAARQDRLTAVTRTVVGIAQPTVQSLGLRGGVVEQYHHTFRVHDKGERKGELVLDEHDLPLRVDVKGDGTVPRLSASRPGSTAFSQQHAALAKMPEVFDLVCDVVTGADREGGRLGEGDIGVTAPQIVLPGESWRVTLTGVDDPAAITCTVEDTAGPWRDLLRPGRRSDGELRADTEVPGPGLYRVVVDGGGTSAVSTLVLAADPESVEPGSD
ncbi:hypothetical protein AB0K60_34905 [Thermopolyspora sp. NPDC052614]|uniref:PGAP1-like alpha/beta domain-containing protein n=1 Tax=Thermopolyspora sp. NPDC052614 TaxID=3155682 RepID=UPI0034487C6E